MITYDQFAAEWMGRVVDYDHVYQFQCVDLILEYIYECYGISGGVAGNAIDYWNSPNPNLMNKFYKVGSSDAIKGDIVVFNGLAGNPYGHIGIATGNINGNDLEILEQNGQDGNGTGQGGNAIRTRYVLRNRVAGILRPATTTPASPSVPMITLDQLTQLYRDLLKREPDQSGIANYVGHYSYDFVADDIKKSAEYAVVNAPKPPDAPLPIPTSTSPYDVIKTVMAFATSNAAANHTDARGVVDVGTYYVFNTRADANGKIIAINVTKIPGQAGNWINPDDNMSDPEPVKTTPVTVDQIIEGRSPVVTTPPPVIEAPKPIDWRTTYKAFSGGTVKYIALESFVLHDLETKKADATVKEDQIIEIAGTFTGPDGAFYGRPLQAVINGRFWWYGARLDNRSSIEPASVFDTTTTLEERQATHTLTTLDYINLALQKIEKVWDVVSPAQLFKASKKEKK